MKFAENNRISHRQLYRQMILTFLAPFLICLPGKNGIQGMTGRNPYSSLIKPDMLRFWYQQQSHPPFSPEPDDT